MSKPPILIIQDDPPAATLRMTDETTDEELSAFIRGKQVVEYEDMIDEQKRIVDAGHEIAGTFPTGLTREELGAWIGLRFSQGRVALSREQQIANELQLYLEVKTPATDDDWLSFARHMIETVKYARDLSPDDGKEQSAGCAAAGF